METNDYYNVTFSSDEPGTPHVEFLESGRFTGHDGCNGFGGQFEVDGDSLSLSPGFSTLKACPGVDGWLQQARTVTLDGDTLHVYGVDGHEIGTLTREG